MPPEAVVFGKSLLVVSPVNLIFFTFYHLFFLDYLMKITHVFSGMYLCAFIFVAEHAFGYADGRLPQLGDRHYPRL